MQLAAGVLGKTIDILGMDACFMSMFEVAFEIRNYVDVLIGAEGLEPEFGWPYHRILPAARLASATLGRPIPTRDLAEIIVREYVNHYADYDGTAGRSADLAAVDLTRMTDLGEAVNALGTTLNANKYRDQVTLAHVDTQTYKSEQFVDLHDFCIQTYKRFEEKEAVRRACRKVVGLLDGNETVFEGVDAHNDVLTTVESPGRCVIRSGCCGFAHQHSYGMSIYFPWSGVAAEYANLAFNGGPNAEKARGGWFELITHQVAETRRAARFSNGKRHISVPPVDLQKCRSKLELRYVERLISRNTGSRATTTATRALFAELNRHLDEALQDNIERNGKTRQERGVPSANAYGQRFPTDNSVNWQQAGPAPESYSEHQSEEQ